MKLETPGAKNKRQAILRGVYEDNLKMKNKAARLQRPPFLRVWGTRVFRVSSLGLIVQSLAVIKSDWIGDTARKT